MAVFARSLAEFQRRFPTDAGLWRVSAGAALACGLRLPGLRARPRLAARSGPRRPSSARRCHRQTSVTAGTVLHRSHLPLTIWFWAAYLMATHSNGISALQLRGLLGIGSYKTAWLLARKLAGRWSTRSACPWPASSRSTRPRCRSAARTTRRPAARPQRHRQDEGRRRGRAQPTASPAACGSPSSTTIRPRACTPSSPPPWPRPAPSRPTPGAAIPAPRWRHTTPRRRPDGGAPRPALAHRAFANLKRWALGTYHGLRRKHLQAYLDEFVFRFNRRHSRPAAFHRLLGLAPPPTRQLPDVDQPMLTG